MPDYSQFNIDRTHPGRSTITFNNPPINVFERVSRRELSGSAKLDGASVRQAYLLQQGRQRRALCGLGTAATVFRRSSRGLQIAAIVVGEIRKVKLGG